MATNDQVQLNDFVADLFNGSARGSATIATNPRAASSVRATFEGVDAGGLLAIATGNAVPLTGAATGTADLRFPGTNFRVASGRVDATFEGATGRDESARTPLTGQLALTADRGTFNIERANLRAGATELNASGRFSFQGGSDLAVNLNSTDAGEFQAVLLATGLTGPVEERLKSSDVALAGSLRFKGTVTGDLDSPVVNGRFELQSLTVRGRDLGALSMDIASTVADTRFNNGRLSEPDGGGISFSAVVPRTGENNIEFDATLENANAGSILDALGVGGSSPNQGTTGAVVSNLSGMGPASGKIDVKGFPGAMQGSADLRVAPGRIGAQPYDEIVARATFNGSDVKLDTFELRLGDGRVTASGGVEIGEGLQGVPNVSVKDFRVEGTNVELGLIASLFGGRRLPALSGKADFNATLSGNPLDPTTLKAELSARGRDVTVNGQPAGELTLTGRMTDDQKFIAELTTGLLGRPQVIRATLDLAGENLPATIETTLTGADLTPLFAALLNNPNVRVTGRAAGTIRASGDLLSEEEGTGFAGRAEFSELTVVVEDVPLAAESPLVVTFKPNEVTFERTRFTGPGTNIVFGGTAALGAGGRMNLTVNGDLNLRVLSSARRNFFMSGVARVAAGVAGTLRAAAGDGHGLGLGRVARAPPLERAPDGVRDQRLGALQLEPGQHRIPDGTPRRRPRFGDGRRAHLGLHAHAVPHRRARRERDRAGDRLRHAAGLPRRPAHHGRRRPRNPRRHRRRLRQRHGQGAPHRDHGGHRPRRPHRPAQRGAHLLGRRRRRGRRRGVPRRRRPWI